MQATPSICSACERLNRVWEQQRDATDVRKCDAFPKGIPSQINPGTFDHREPFGGEESGMLFLLRDDEGARRKLQLYEEMSSESANG